LASLRKARKPGKRALHDPAPFEDMEATRPDLLPINHGILWGPDPSKAAPGMFDDLHLPAERRFDPLDEACTGYLAYPFQRKNTNDSSTMSFVRIIAWPAR
jgi:hypothetical protein